MLQVGLPMTRTHRNNLFVISLLAIIQLCGSGCAKPEEEAAVQADSAYGFSSAAALLNHYNSITTREPVDIVAAYDLCYAENDFQQRYIKTSRRMKPFAELDRAMLDTFGECFDPKRKKHMLSADQAATITREDEQRAEAQFVNSDGESKTLHMVKVGDRWWVSGFTFEYDPQVSKYKQDFSVLERLTDAFAAAAPAVTEGIRSGKIATAAEARSAFAAATASKAGPT